MSFQWDVPPDVWVTGIDNYEDETLNTLFSICQKHAERMQAYMRANAPWEDECDPERTYLRAEAYYPGRWSVGIRIWYDLEAYRAKCGEPPFDWSVRHELATFKKKGVISIIAPRGETEGAAAATALGSLADDLWDEIRSLYPDSLSEIVF